MKRTMFRPAVAFAILATVAGVTPAHAGPADGWVLINTGSVMGGGPDLDPVVNVLLETIANAGKGKVCTPQASSITPGGLSWSVYRSSDGLRTAFEWHGPGSAMVTDDCADELNMTVGVTDAAPSGDPATAQGAPGFGWDSVASNGEFRTAATSDDFVVYYDISRGYVRAIKAVIEIKVTATYYNKKAKAWLPLGCRQTHTVITPTPTGPSDATAGPVEDCGA